MNPVSPSSASSDAASTSLACLDQQKLFQLVDNDLELLGEIVDLFLEDAPGWLDGIREAISNQDAEALRLAAHALKGAVSNFAAADAVAFAVRLEEIGSSGSFDGAAEALAELEAEMGRLSLALRSITGTAS